MNKIPIPSGALMRMRSRGRYVYAINKKPIVWQTKFAAVLPGKSVSIYCVAWSNSQNNFTASEIIEVAG